MAAQNIGNLPATNRLVGTKTSLDVSIVDGSGNHVTSFGGSGGTSEQDDADFTDGSTSGTPAMGVYESTPSTVTDGDLGIVGITEDRALRVNVDNAGSIGGGTQYTQGDTDSSITGTAMLMEGASETLLPVQGTVADGLLVNLGSNNDVTVSGVSTAAKQDTIIGHVDGIEALLGTIDADTSTLAAAVSTEVQCDIVGALPAGDNNIGNVDIVSGTITTVSTVTSVTAIANALPAGTNNIGDVDVLTVPRSQSGPGQPGTAIDNYTHAAINLSAAADQVLVSSAASKQIWVYGIGFTLSVAGSVSFQDEDNTAITGVMPFAANSGLAVPPSGNFSMPIWKLATDKDLEVDLVTADMDGWIDYAIVSV